MKHTRLLFAVLMAPSLLSAQEQDAEFYRHALSGGPSLGDVIGGDGPRSSSIGLDYLYRLSPKWEVGVQLDLNYGKGFDGFESYAVVPIISYAIADSLPIFVGAGIEHREESGDDEFVARAGFEYNIPLDNDERWSLLPGGFIDVVSGETILSGVLSVGYSF